MACYKKVIALYGFRTPFQLENIDKANSQSDEYNVSRSYHIEFPLFNTEWKHGMERSV